MVFPRKDILGVLAMNTRPGVLRGNGIWTEGATVNTVLDDSVSTDILSVIQHWESPIIMILVKWLIHLWTAHAG